MSCADPFLSLASVAIVHIGEAVVLGGLFLLGACRPSRESITAGQVGCNPDEIQISDENSSMGWGQSSESWTATCAGRTFVCSQLNTSTTALVSDGKTATTVGANDSDVACHERLSDTPATPSKAAATPNTVRSGTIPSAPAPTAGAGFDLGADRAATQQVCESAGLTWGASAKGFATCSGAAVDLGFPADVRIKFCDGKACIITLHHRPESEWSSTFAELKGKLTMKYGTPTESEAVVPPSCRSEAEFVDCLTNHSVRLHFSWRWPTGEGVILSVGKAEPESDAAIRVDYTRPVRKVAVNADAL